jgi:chemotaxis signal transduction protein
VKDESRASGKAAELRRGFDQSFAEVRHPETDLGENLLAISVGSALYALKLTEVSGLFTDKKVIRVPGPIRELLGIAAFRGTLLPVYDLRALLGQPVNRTPRWLAVAAAMPVGLAFDQFDGHAHVNREAIVPVADAGAGPTHVREVVHAPHFVRPIVHLPSLLEALETRTRDGARARSGNR